MKRNQFILSLLGAGAITFSAFTTDPSLTLRLDDDTKPYDTKTFTGTISAVRAETSGGSLTVEGTSGSGAKVELYVRPNNWNGRNELDKAEIEERLKEYDVNIRQEGSTIIATAKRRSNDNNWKRSLSIGFKIYTPRTVSTTLRTSGGSIRLSDIAGNQDFRTSGGSLHLTKVEGDISGQTSGGSIHLDRCRNDRDGRIDLQTSGGSIHAQASEGKMRLHTSGGSIELNDLQGTIDARTSGGSVRGSDIAGTLKAGTSGGSVRLANVSGSLDASTSAGSIEVSLTKLGDYVRLSTTAGSVRVKMPMNKGLDLDLSGNRVEVGTLTNFSGSHEKDRVRGKINGGGVPVEIAASSGSVYLNR
ncbi:hypothetical protein DYU11_32265 [Fibrisoma montanum]|uniref:DUF4097 domain-containing protein n=1 Tax=Fibrisoma montanum TaxID=2305895 RepID=A0A418LVT9_9BACT|nr:DUF4097 family beta strand repeat-containing protein [Fibrisoma montanum]RIV17365.1 hypothetical protein DYU11_32265 [Fibrisoma montanum]